MAEELTKILKRIESQLTIDENNQNNRISLPSKNNLMDGRKTLIPKHHYNNNILYFNNDNVFTRQLDTQSNGALQQNVALTKIKNKHLKKDSKEEEFLSSPKNEDIIKIKINIDDIEKKFQKYKII